MENFFNIGLYQFLATSIILFSIGLFGAVISQNLLKILISLEIMFCAVTLNIVAFTVYSDNSHVKGFILALFILFLTAVHISIGAAIILNLYKFKASTDIQDVGELKG